MSQLSLTLQRHVNGWRGDLIALIAGALTSLAFAPFSLWPLAILASGLLFITWMFSTAKRAAWRGGLFGVGLFGIGISWVFVSIYYHGHVGLSLSLLLTTLLVLVMAAFQAGLGYCLIRYFPPRFECSYSRYKLLLVMPAAWVLAEWVRSWFMTGFPWLSLGYSQTDSALSGIAPLLGMFGVSWLVVLCGALLVAIVLDRAARLYCIFALMLIALLSAVAQNTFWTQPHGAPIKVTLLQGNIPQDLKWHPDVRRPTIELYTELTRESWDADLIVWPETALPAFYYEVEGFIDDLEVEARENDTDMLVGLLTFDESKKDYYNTMLSLGSSREQYHKNHLVPFTEYLPMKWLLGDLVRFMQVPMSDFRRGGDYQAPLNVAGQRAGISICFEDAFGEEIIKALPEATFLVNVSNDAWFDDSWAPPQHLQIARMRAIETERPLLRATNTGMTAIIDAKGQVRVQAPQFEITSISDTIQPRGGSTLYVMVGNWLVVMGALLALAVGVWRRRSLAE